MNIYSFYKFKAFDVKGKDGNETLGFLFEDVN